jgi:hypothetical protein
VETTLHITSGDISGGNLTKSGVPGEVLVWHDILYEEARKPGWPDRDGLRARTRFLVEGTDGGLSPELVLKTLETQYAKLERAGRYQRVVLWFDACLFDQSMLCHILNCMRSKKVANAELLCIDSFPGIEPYHGIGQLSPEQLASCYPQRRPLTEDQVLYAERIDRAFALQDRYAFEKISREVLPPLPWVPAAVARWLQEYPDEKTGLGLLERNALEAIRSGKETPADIFAYASAKEVPPQFWGDIMLWGKINGLADREPPLVEIEGPLARLPQWEGIADLGLFRVRPV